MNGVNAMQNLVCCMKDSQLLCECVCVCLAKCVSQHPAESLTCANICLASRPYWLSVFFADCVCLCGCVHVCSA